jgi:type IV pilus assembly protein PilP
LVLLLCGCDRITAAEMKPTVVRKKIVIAGHQTATADKTQPLAMAKAAPDIKEEAIGKQPPGEEVQASVKEQTALKTEADARPLIDSKTKTVSAQAAAVTAPKKPTLKPKSDMTQIKDPIQIESPSSGNEIKAIDESLKGDDLIASTAVVVQTQKPLQTPQIYDPTDKIDPFQPLIKDQPVTEKKKERKRTPQTPLERIDLSQLKLVGIILASSGNRALVEEATGKGYVIKKGTYIGTNSGKVLQIDKDKIIIEEEFEDVLGNTKIRERELKLPKPPGEF